MTTESRKNHGPRAPLEVPEATPLVAPADFGARAAALGATLDDATIARIGDYLARLLAMNTQVNLTAITDPIEVWEKHALDAVALIPLIPKGARVIDVGSGGGVPALPLAIARPDCAIAMVESTQKKAVFLGTVARALGLANVTVHAVRAEQLAAHEKHRAAYDVATARAVARLAALVPITAPFVKAGGALVLVKGAKADEELAEAAPVLAAQGVAHERTLVTPTGRIVVLRR